MGAALDILKAAVAKTPQQVVSGGDPADLIDQEIAKIGAGTAEVLPGIPVVQPPAGEMTAAEEAGAGAALAQEPPFDVTNSEENVAKAQVKPIELTPGQIDGLTAAQLNKTAAAHNIVIEGWAGMKPAEKKAALKEHLSPEFAAKGDEVSLPVPVSGAVKPKGKAAISNADPLQQAAFKIENMDEAAVLQGVKEWRSREATSFFEIGGYLNAMQTNGWFGGHKDLKEFCIADLGIGYRTARYFISCYDLIITLGLTYDQVSSMGWSKLKELAANPGVLTPDNLLEWVKKADDLNAIDFAEAVKQAAGKEGSGGTILEGDKPLKTLSFKVFEDQQDTIKSALSKVKEVGGTDSDAKALEYMALEYLNTGSPAPAPAPVVVQTALPTDEAMIEYFKSIGPQRVLEGVAAAFEDIVMSVDDLGSWAPPA